MRAIIDRPLAPLLYPALGRGAINVEPLRVGVSLVHRERRLAELLAGREHERAGLEELVEDAALLGGLELAGCAPTWDEVRASRAGEAPPAVAGLRQARAAVEPQARSRAGPCWPGTRRWGWSQPVSGVEHARGGTPAGRGPPRVRRLAPGAARELAGRGQRRRPAAGPGRRPGPGAAGRDRPLRGLTDGAAGGRPREGAARRGAPADPGGRRSRAPEEALRRAFALDTARWWRFAGRGRPASPRT